MAHRVGPFAMREMPPVLKAGGNFLLGLAARTVLAVCDARAGSIHSARNGVAQGERSYCNARTNNGKDQRIFCGRSAAVVTKERSCKFNHDTTPIQSLRVSPPDFVVGKRFTKGGSA